MSRTAFHVLAELGGLRIRENQEQKTWEARITVDGADYGLAVSSIAENGRPVPYADAFPHLVEVARRTVLAEDFPAGFEADQVRAALAELDQVDGRSS